MPVNGITTFTHDSVAADSAESDHFSPHVFASIPLNATFVSGAKFIDDVY